MNGESQDKLLQYFLVTTALLFLFGLIMIFSASYLFAKEHFGYSTYFFFRQIVYALLGCGIIYAVAHIPPAKFPLFGQLLFLGLLLLLVATFVPGLGLKVKGAHRWINFRIFLFQPGEMIKYALIIPAAYFLDEFSVAFNKENLFRGALLLIPLVLLPLQPDFGSFVICLFILFYLCYMSSFPKKYFYSFLGGATSIAIILVVIAPYRLRRVLVFLDPWKDPLKSGFQIIQSYLALAGGNITGRGIGNSTGKLYYLPEAHNDFIASVIGEEMGLLGLVVLVFAFVYWMYLGFKIASKIAERKMALIVSAAVFAVSIQVFLNMGVVLGLLPTKGLNLPFISYGGSSLLANCFAVGLIIAGYRNFIVSKESST